MRAIILAAGRGLRLQQRDAAAHPKCLLRFDGTSLLERHLRMLAAAEVDEVVVAVGFESGQVESELKRLGFGSTVETVFNPHFELGSMLTVHTTRAAMERGGDVLLMDADVLYDERIMRALVAGERADRLLIDRDFVAGDEPVKVCLKDGVPVEFRKKIEVGLDYDTIGESVGFFRFTETTSRRLTEIVAGYVERGCSELPHEEAVRDLLLERGRAFDVADTTGAPWIEIDFPDDIARAHDRILPKLRSLTAPTTLREDTMKAIR